ncbi:MAG TPA: hypothetical protein VIM85_01710, partial [Pseudomonadales bacterium]
GMATPSGSLCVPTRERGNEQSLQQPSQARNLWHWSIANVRLYRQSRLVLTPGFTLTQKITANNAIILHQKSGLYR